MRVFSQTTTGSRPTGCTRCAAPCSRSRRRARRDRPGLQPQRHRAQHHHPLAAVGRGDRASTTAPVGFATDGTPVDCVRFAELGLIGESARADRLGHQPRRQPRRRHHLLGHGRRGARGRSCSGMPAIAVSQQSNKRRDGLPLRPRVRLRRSPPRSRRGWSRRRASDPLPPGTLLNVNCPAGRAERGHRGHPARQAHLQRRAASWSRRTPTAAAGAATGSTATSPRYHDEHGHRLRGDRAGHDLGHAAPLRPHRPRSIEQLARLGPVDGLLGAAPTESDRRRRAQSPSAASERPSCGGRSSTTTTATTCSTTRRSRTPTTTTLLRELRGARGGSTRSCVTPDSPTQRVGGRAAREVRAGAAPAADALARQRPRRGGAARLGAAPAATCSSGTDIDGRAIALRDRAEDRRARDLAGLRGRRASRAARRAATA